MTNIKITESELFNYIWKLYYTIHKTDNGLSKQDIEQIERHWKMLKLITEDIFDTRYRSSSSDKIGNI